MKIYALNSITTRSAVNSVILTTTLFYDERS